jgi:hypothetical protein
MLTNLQDKLTGIDDPHAPATVLKNWFRQLEQALIPDNVYDECVKIGQMEDRAEARNGAWKMMRLMLSCSWSHHSSTRNISEACD